MTTRPIVLTATPVGFAPNGEVDYAASRRILESVAASGTDGALVLGTTGEFPALTDSERHELTALSLEVLAGKQVVVHVGAPSAYQVKRYTADAVALGARAVAVLTPYYLPASDEAMLDFYRSVVESAGDVDVYAYLFTARTGNTVSPELLARLAELPHLVGAKISGETLETVARYRAAAPAGFRIFTGGDRDIARVIDHGLTGVVSGVSSAFPKPFAEMADAVASGDTAGIARLQKAVDTVVDAVLGDPERMKVALAMQGIDAGTSRMALDPVDEAARAELRNAVDAYA